MDEFPLNEANVTEESPEAENDYIFDLLYVQVIFIILYTVVFCFCFFGNILVLLVITLHWKMRVTTKFCLANLCVADLCVGIFCIFQNLSTYLIQSWVLGEYLCKMYQFVNALSLTSSVLILVVISIERYLAIIHPLQCRQILTLNRLRKINATVWVVSGLYCSPRLYYMNTIVVPRYDGGQEIICTAQRTRYDSKTFDMVNAFLMFILPLTVIMVLYTRIGVTLWRSTGHEWTNPRMQMRSNFVHQDDCSVEEDSFIESLPSPSHSHCKSIRNDPRLSVPVHQSNNKCITTKRFSLSRASTKKSNHNHRPRFSSMRGERSMTLDMSKGQNGDFPPGRYCESAYVYVEQASNKSCPCSNQSMSIWPKPQMQIKEGNDLCKFCRGCLKNEDDGRVSPSVPLQEQQKQRRGSRPKRKSCQMDESLEPLETCSSMGGGDDRRPSNFRMSRHGRSTRQHLHQQQKTFNFGKQQLKSRQCVVRMLIILVISFAAFNCPYHLRKIVLYWWPQVFQSDDLWATLATPLSHLLLFCSSAANPIIYSFLSSSFRACLRDLVCCKWRKSFRMTTGNDNCPDTPRS